MHKSLDTVFQNFSENLNHTRANNLISFAEAVSGSLRKNNFTQRQRQVLRRLQNGAICLFLELYLRGHPITDSTKIILYTEESDGRGYNGHGPRTELDLVMIQHGIQTRCVIPLVKLRKDIAIQVVKAATVRRKWRNLGSTITMCASYEDFKKSIARYVDLRLLVRAQRKMIDG